MSQPRRRWYLTLRTLHVAALIVGAPVVLPLLPGGGDWWGFVAFLFADPWPDLLVPLGFGAVMLAVLVATLHPSARDVQKICHRIERDWRYLTERRWALRVGTGGVLAGCVIGIPIGALMASDLGPAELGEIGGGVGAVMRFLGMTLLWTVPGAYLFRQGILRDYRPLLRETRPGDGDIPGR